MPRVEHNSSMPTSLHYALTDSQCSICGEQLEWQGDFDNINQPKYVSQHCNEDYAINIETVKVEILRKASKDKQGQEQQKNFMSTNKEDEQPKALQMAEAMKRHQQQQHQQQQEEEEEQPQVQDQQEQGDNPPNPT
jgi:hypothetical protein